MSATDSTTNDKIIYPPVDNSIKFEIGDATITANMLELYKGWEKNDLAKMKKHFADSVTMYGFDGSVIQGSADTVLALNQAYRNNYTTMKPQFHSFVPLKSMDRNENWFLMWYKEYQTDTKGKTVEVELMESWKLNNVGKVVALYQYIQNKPEAPKK
jgi:hypothetical protein